MLRDKDSNLYMKIEKSRTLPSRHSFSVEKVNETPEVSHSEPHTSAVPHGPWGDVLKPSSLA
jgi:hypothetical protein